MTYQRRMRRRSGAGGAVWISKTLVGVVAIGVTQAAVADFALTNLGQNRLRGTPVANTVHGWEFIANVNIIVTHLGLFDALPDGFNIDHPIGLFNLADELLLTSGTMSAGEGDPLIDEFRYIDTPDVGLVAGRTYVISYYSATYPGDLLLLKATFDVNPAITYVQGRWGTDAGGLAIPPNGTSNNRIGPNFQFVPADCPADLDGDGIVGPDDLTAILAAWDNKGGPEDLDGNGIVDFGDLLIVLAAWGPCE